MNFWWTCLCFFLQGIENDSRYLQNFCIRLSSGNFQQGISQKFREKSAKFRRILKEFWMNFGFCEENYWKFHEILSQQLSRWALLFCFETWSTCHGPKLASESFSAADSLRAGWSQFRTRYRVRNCGENSPAAGILEQVWGIRHGTSPSCTSWRIWWI